MELEQSDWCTMGLGHNVSSTQPEWNKTGLVHNRLTPFLAPSPPPPPPPSQSKDHSLAPGREGWTWSLWRWPTSCAACPCIPTAHSPQPLAMGHAWGRSLGPPLPPPHSRPLLASRPAANQLPRAQTRCPAWRCGSDWRRSDRPGTWGSTGWTRTRVGTGGESGKQRQGDDVSLPATAAAPATRQTVFYTILRSAASAKTAGFRYQHLLPCLLQRQRTFIFFPASFKGKEHSSSSLPPSKAKNIHLLPCLLQRQRTFPDSVKLGFSFYVSSTDHSLCKSQVWQTQNFKHDKSRLKSNFECESSSTGSSSLRQEGWGPQNDFFKPKRYPNSEKGKKMSIHPISLSKS